MEGGYTLVYDDWNTEGDLWFSNRTDAKAQFEIMRDKKIAGKPAYASITVRSDRSGRVIYHFDCT